MSVRLPSVVRCAAIVGRGPAAWRRPLRSPAEDMGQIRVGAACANNSRGVWSRLMRRLWAVYPQQAQQVWSVVALWHLFFHNHCRSSRMWSLLAHEPAQATTAVESGRADHRVRMRIGPGQGSSCPTFCRECWAHLECGVGSRYALAMAGREGRKMTPCSPRPTRASG